jgi:hypothetical protein
LIQVNFWLTPMIHPHVVREWLNSRVCITQGQPDGRE